jgi:SAM-dependent methyltransferase
MELPMQEWFEDESFWIDLYPFFFPEERFEAAREEVEKILKLLDFHGDSILDLACGPGRTALILAEKGLEVTGVDCTAFHLGKGRARAKDQGLEIEWVQEDIRHFTRPEAFDLVLNFCSSFGYFDDKGDDIKVLEKMFANLRGRGQCLIELAGKEVLARIFQPTFSQKLPNGNTLVRRHEIFDDWTRIRNECLLIKEGTVKTFRFHHTIYSGQELRNLLEMVGFHEVHVYGSLDGEEYGTDAQRLIIVGRKRDS